MPLENAYDDLDVIEIESIRCNFCNDDLTILPLSGREAHYEHHLVNDITAEGLVAGSRALPIDLDRISESSNTWKSGSDTMKGFPKKKFSFKKPEADVFWYPVQRTLPPRNCTPGLIPILRKSLLKSHHSGQIRRAALCYDKTVHIRREIWDASWGCGYRNFLMACAALMSQTQQPMYFPLLDSPLPPSVRNLQIWIEDAWKEGFDTEGKDQLKKLIGTKKWVGTADIWVALVSRRIPAELVDFDFRNKERGPETLIDWVVEYFTPKATHAKSANAFDSIQSYPITNTTKMPLILQHDGHSRTVVGYETDRNGITKLLIFDPAYHISNEIRDYAMSEGLEIDSIRQASGSSTPLSKQSSNTLGPTASPSVLKRKRSVNASTQDTKQPRTTENIQAKVKPYTSPTQTLKNRLLKVNLSHKEFDPSVIIKRFRLEPKILERKKQYQILYFPMAAPLTDYERTQRKSVTSLNIT